MDRFIGYLMDAARWLIVLVLSFLSPELYSSWTGKVVEITRPDEIRVQRDEKVETVRMYGVDSPLPPQEFWQQAERYTSSRLLDRSVVVQPVPGRVEGPWYWPTIRPRDRYGRIIGLVSVDGELFNKELLRKGMAWWYRPFVPFERGFKQLETQARRAHVGLWGRGDRVSPWDFQGTEIDQINPGQRGTAITRAARPEPSERPPVQTPPAQVEPRSERPVVSQPPEPAVKAPKEDQGPPSPPREPQPPIVEPPTAESPQPASKGCRDERFLERLRKAYVASCNLSTAYLYTAGQIEGNWDHRAQLASVYAQPPLAAARVEELIREVGTPPDECATEHEDLLSVWRVCRELRTLTTDPGLDLATYRGALLRLQEDFRNLTCQLDQQLPITAK